MLTIHEPEHLRLPPQLWPERLRQPPPTNRLALQAAAGMGKSALAAHYYQQWHGPRLWLSLSNILDDPRQLQAALAAALHLPATSDETLLAKALAQQGLWVLDQLDAFNHDACHQLLLRLSAHWPGMLIITSRPCRWLPQWLLQQPQQWHCWGDAELRLDDNRALQLARYHQRPEQEPELQAINHYFDGWPTLWQLWLQRPVSRAHLAQWLGPLRAYLLATRLAALAPPARQLLTQLASYVQFDEELAMAVSDQPFAAQLLDELRQLALVRPLPGSPHELQLPPYLRQLLRAEASLQQPHLLLTAHQRAVAALLAREQGAAAAQLALESGAHELLLAVLQQQGWRLYHQAAFGLLRQLFAQLEHHHWRQQGELLLLHGWLVVEGESDCAQGHRQLQQWLPPLYAQPQWPRLAPRFAILRAEIARQFDQLDDALALTDHVDDALLHAHDRIALGYTRAMAALQLGRLPEAEQALNHLARATTAEQLHHHSLWVWQRQAVVACQRQQWPLARAALANAEQLAAQHQLGDDHALDSLWRARAELAQLFGDWPAAAAAIARGGEREHPLGEYWELPYRALILVQAIAERNSLQINRLRQQLGQQLAGHSYCQQWQLRARQALLLAAVVQGAEGELHTLADALQTKADQHHLPALQQQLLLAWCHWHLGQPPQIAPQLATACQNRELGWLAWRWQLLHTVALAPAEPPDAVIDQLQQGYIWDLLLAGPRALPLWERWLTGRALARNDAAHASLLRVIDWCATTVTADDDSLRPCPDERLTAAEWRVLQLIGRGYRNEQIAARLFVAPSTIKSHINHLYAKLGLTSRSSAKALANQWLS